MIPLASHANRFAALRRLQFFETRLQAVSQLTFQRFLRSGLNLGNNSLNKPFRSLKERPYLMGRQRLLGSPEIWSTVAQSYIPNSAFRCEPLPMEATQSFHPT